ncbi:MAG TPA: hypothetical protein PLA20_05390 [Bacilli bacterium]|jgi:hypothetical protein|nr:hypothetical protein [Acholeplasmataceae bacterium]OQB62816.1 MAG: hypothetical protein BWX94_00944 [Tenericutes bacterium ADurb.Bin140]HOE77747.1 hypothetical protein [Bacilli bacterium]HON63986.1 hypothetical protein [Bacilli bacterium]HOR96282.1 hypothetical protein [Bacilli bacterium]
MKKVLFLVVLLVLAGATGCKGNQTETLIDRVDLAIDQFVQNYANQYVKETETGLILEYHVVAALKALEKSGFGVTLENYLTANRVEADLQNRPLNLGTEAFSALVIARSFDLACPKAEQFLAELTTFDAWNQSYLLMALNYTGSNNYLKQAILNDILNVEGKDADYAGAALMALSHQETDKTPLIDLIKENLTSEGVLSWGTANSCTTAYAILGLVANNIDPTSEEFTKDTVNLVEALLNFSLGDGSFAYSKDSGADLSYATPQSFAALVAYREFVRTQKSFVLFQ